MEKITLPNGARIVHEQLEHIRSASAGIWINNGSRDEKREQSGISHFIEHMLFKGTSKRSAAEMAELFDSIGGRSNAFTTKESTAYYAKALDEHMQLVMELLCDMLMEPLFDETETETERGVILEEIGMYNDSPEDISIEKLSEAVYKDSMLGMPILGEKKSLRKICGANMREYMREKYTASNIVVSISGRYDDSVLQYICERFAELPRGTKNQSTPAKYTPTVFTKKKAYEQNHIAIMFPSIQRDDKRRFALNLLNSILGEGVSSRLFQRVREQQGLCYSVYSFAEASRNEGLFGIYTATNRDTEEKAVRAIMEELRRIKCDGVTKEELLRVKQQMKANLLMGLESTNTRASAMARSELMYGEAFDPDNAIRKYEEVTRETILELAQLILDFEKASVSAVGRISAPDFYESMARGTKS